MLHFFFPLHFYIDMVPKILIPGSNALTLLTVLLRFGSLGSAVGSGTALQVGRSRVRFLMLSLEFVIEINLLAAACNRNEYQEFFLWGKGDR